MTLGAMALFPQFKREIIPSGSRGWYDLPFDLVKRPQDSELT